MQHNTINTYTYNTYNHNTYIYNTPLSNRLLQKLPPSKHHGRNTECIAFIKQTVYGTFFYSNVLQTIQVLRK